MARDAVIIGAGRIGRGFMGEVMSDAGCDVTFVDANRALVEAINQRGCYTLFKALPTGLERRVIGGVKAIHMGDSGAVNDVLSRPGTAVAVALNLSAYAEAAGHIALAVARRAIECPDSPQDILFAANSIKPARTMAKTLDAMLGGTALDYLNNMVGLSDAVILRMMTDPTAEMLRQDPICSLNSGYPYMPIDALALRDEPLPTPMIQLSNDIDAEETRKIYTLNAAHAVMAYKGAMYGCVTAHEAISDPRVYSAVIGALDESAAGLCKKFGFKRHEMAEWNAQVLAMLKNELLADTVSRLGADSARKLAVDDRLVGPAVLCWQAGVMPENLISAIACGYLFGVSGDEGTEKTLSTVKRLGIVSAIEVISGIDIKHPLQNAILEAFYSAKYEQEDKS